MMKKDLAAKLENLREYYSELGGYAKYGPEEIKKNRMLRRALERSLEIALECMLDIGEMVISSENLKKPDTYREIIEVLGKEGIIPQDLAERLAPAASLRNVLVHMYSEVDVDRICEFLSGDLQDISLFAKYVAEHAGRKGRRNGKTTQETPKK